MDKGRPAIGFGDGAIDIDEWHVSMDSVGEMRDVSHDLGASNAGLAWRREDGLSRNILDSVSDEVEVDYFRSQNELCSMGADYFLGYAGVGFNESITNLDFGSNEGLLTSVSDSSVLASNSSPWKADIFRIMDTSEFGEVPSLWHELQTLSEHKSPNSPTSCNLQDIGKIHDTSSCNFHDILPYGNVSGLSPQVKMFRHPKNEKNDEFGQTGQNGGSNRLKPMSACEEWSGDLPRQKRLCKPVSNGNGAGLSSPVKMFRNPKNEKNADYRPTDRNSGSNRLKPLTTREECNGDFPTQKRLRKTTQRYIDELMDPISRYPKRRQDVSCWTIKDKSMGDKDQKKCCVGSRNMALPTEESSAVHFGSLLHKECPKNPASEMVPSSDRGSNPIIKSEDECDTTQNQKRRDERTTALHLKKRNSDHIVTTTHVKKRDTSTTAPSPKKRDDCPKTVMRKNRCDESDDCSTEESSEEAGVRRKHHRLWTIAEVKKLIDGVSECGVGRWSRIKKLYFSASAHRTPADLKDKWRNLLKARVNQQGEKKRNVAWRPLPKSILRRVCELAGKHVSISQSSELHNNKIVGNSPRFSLDRA